VLVNFWGLRCGACLEEMPVLASLHEKYNPRGLSILGVNVDGVGADTIKAHLPRVAKVPPYPLVTDEELKIADLYKMNAAPLTVLVDSGGKVAYVHEGYKAGDEAALVEILEKLVR
jgi:thiol-disulfide isomerase/thioredoxin